MERSFAYFDYAATTFMPKCVLDKYIYYQNNICVSANRGNNKLTACADEILGESRGYIKHFFAGSGEEEFIFYRSASHALNEIAYGLEHTIESMDIILLGPYEHHSNYLPWRELARRTGAVVFEMPVLADGSVNYEYLNEIKSRVKILAFSSVANTNGYLLKMSEMEDFFDEKTIVIVDDSQKCAHDKIEISARIDCHILNAHKMYGPKGIAGALVSKRFLQILSPCIYGGGMVERVGFPNVWKSGVEKYECGTLDIAGIYAWREACNYIKNLGWDCIAKKEKEDYQQIRELLEMVEGIKIISSPECHSLLSFCHEKIHAHDIESLFSERNVIVRAGHLCSQNSIAKYGMQPVVRISFGVGNTKRDMEMLINAIGECL